MFFSFKVLLILLSEPKRLNHAVFWLNMWTFLIIYVDFFNHNMWTFLITNKENKYLRPHFYVR